MHRPRASSTCASKRADSILWGDFQSRLTGSEPTSTIDGRDFSSTRLANFSGAGVLHHRAANRACDRSARCAAPQIIGNLELGSLAPRSAIADVERMTPRVFLTRHIDRETGLGE